MSLSRFSSSGSFTLPKKEFEVVVRGLEGESVSMEFCSLDCEAILVLLARPMVSLPIAPVSKERRRFGVPVLRGIGEESWSLALFACMLESVKNVLRINCFEDMRVLRSAM